MRNITILDSTLRDGAQGEGLSFSLQDKLNLVQTLDDFGIEYIEAGTPGSNPKDLEFFKKAGSLALKQAKLCAFGATRHKETSVTKDEGIAALLSAKTPAVSLVGKASKTQAEKILGVSKQENAKMITDSIRYLKRHGKEILFDAEHFFDGYLADREFALAMLSAAADAGADVLVLCDTNGGRTPTEILKITRAVCKAFPQCKIGIHAHNDSGCSVANSMLAVEAGALHVQGTFCGFGERCGNADLSVIIPNLLLKKQCVSHVQHLERLCEVAACVAEIANVSIPGDKPYVGRSAFAHKGGMHTDGMLKMKGSFEHISPELVGNHRRYLMSEVSGRAAFVEKARRFLPSLTKDSPEAKRLVEKLKEMEFHGYQFEAADASFEMMVLRELGLLKRHFDLVQYKTIGEYPAPDGQEQASAMIEVKVGNRTEISAAIGDGPVHALDLALRRALTVFYPTLKKVHLIDYKVRVLDSESATAAKVRVLIDSTDGTRTWTTVGVSTDIIEASWLALADSIEYQLK